MFLFQKIKGKIYLLFIALITLLLFIFLGSNPVSGASNPALNIYDISEGDITITVNGPGTSVTIAYGASLSQVSPIGTPITLIGSATATGFGVDVVGNNNNSIVVPIELNNLVIGNVSNPNGNVGGQPFSAFDIRNGGNVSMTLVGNNVLQSGKTRAGLRVSSTDNGVLTIDGPGTLYAASNGGGAGIGGNSAPNGGSGGHITINGGTITAVGTTIATEVGIGAGIGGGTGGTAGAGGHITINGGVVRALSGSNSLLSDGIGAGSGTTPALESDTVVKITGGSVFAEGIPRVEYNGIYPRPVGADGTTPVYFSALTVGATPVANAPVISGSRNAVDFVPGVSATLSEYGINDVLTDSGGKLYFWFPMVATEERVAVTVGTTYYSNNFIREDSSEAETLFTDIQVSFDTRGGTSIPSQSVPFAGLITEPAEPEKTNYVFNGWNTASDGSGMVWEFNTPLDTTELTFTLYAQWSLKPPTPLQVTYSGNGNSQGTAPVDANVYYVGDDVVVLGKGNLARTDHHFTGWALTGNSTSIDYLPGDIFKMAEAVELYAVWEKDSVVPPVVNPPVGSLEASTLPKTGGLENNLGAGLLLFIGVGIFSYGYRKDRMGK